MKTFLSERLLLWIVVMIARQKCVHSSECLQWISNLDGKYRSHCYEYHHGPQKSTFEAETECKNSGGQLAPYIDDFQYDFWNGFLPNSSGQIIIGINDLVKEGVWTSFDGTPVSNLPWYPGQPEGHRDENCVWIERNPFTLRDKSCSDKCHNFLCYNDAMCFTDDVTDCFWFISDKKGWNFHEANAQCKEQDGVLASVKSSDHFEFLKRAFENFTVYTGIESAWLGVHFIGDQHRNVNGDELPESVIDLTNAPDNCLQLYVVPADSGVQYPNYQHSFISCGNTTPMAGVCTRLKHGHRWYTEKNSTSDAYIRDILKIDKLKTTNLYKSVSAFFVEEVLKHNSVFDGRTSSTGIGIVGVSVIVAVMTFMVILDCGKRPKIDEKKKKKKQKNQTEHQTAKLRVKNKISMTKV